MYSTLLAISSAACPMCGLLFGCRCDEPIPMIVILPDAPHQPISRAKAGDIDPFETEEQEIARLSLLPPSAPHADAPPEPQETDPQEDRYPCLAERLALSMRDDRRP